MKKDPFTRRQFLIASGAAAVALSAGTIVTWESLSRSAATAPLAAGSKILVIVTLYGGNDGINTVIPYADSAYHDARPDFAYTPDQVLRLDDKLGLNPALKGMEKLWKKNQLAIVRGVDYPKPDHSHFRSMDIWQTASPATPVNTGWIGRWLDANGDEPIRAVNIGSVLPPMAVGAKNAAAALIPGASKPFGAGISTALTGLGKTDTTDTDVQLTVAQSYCSERTVTKTFQDVIGGEAPPSGHTTTNTAHASRSDLAGQLDLVARCIKAGVPTKVYTASLGGFDTHADEKGTQEKQLGLLDTALSSFLSAVSTSPHGRDVVVMVYSEFGRRVKANASDGTDHGTAGPVFLAGPGVAGGFHGEQPSLTDLDNGDLKWSIDFRRIYAEVLSGTLHADPKQILGSTFAPVGVLA
ncbi:MAG: DUF1501 domain-containing protein [Lacisediminihabitans sp.]